MIRYACTDGKCVTLMSNAYGTENEKNQFSSGLLSNMMN